MPRLSKVVLKIREKKHAIAWVWVTVCLFVIYTTQSIMVLVHVLTCP